MSKTSAVEFDILKCPTCKNVFEWKFGADGFCEKCRDRFHWHGKEIVWLYDLKNQYRRLDYDVSMAVELFDCLYIEPECTLDEKCWCEDCRKERENESY